MAKRDKFGPQLSMPILFFGLTGTSSISSGCFVRVLPGDPISALSKKELFAMSGHHHIVTPKTYGAVLVGLMALMSPSSWPPRCNIGPEDQHLYNLVLALAIAFCKMSLIILFSSCAKQGEFNITVAPGMPFGECNLFVVFSTAAR